MRDQHDAELDGRAGKSCDFAAAANTSVLTVRTHRDTLEEQVVRVKIRPVREFRINRETGTAT